MSKSQQLNELEVVVVTRAIPDSSITPGELGAIVHVYASGDLCEVEVVDDHGSTRSVVTAPSSSLWPVGGLGKHDLLLLCQYLKVGLTVDQLPYRPEFEQIFNALQAAGDDRDKASVYQTLLKLRKSGALPSVA